MVKYIKLGKEKPEKNSKKKRTGKYLLIGATAAIIAGATYEYNRNIDYWKPRAETILSINSPKSLEYRINNLKEDLKEFPQYTDILVLTGIKTMNEEDMDFSKDTYLEMFNVMKNKFEEKPKLLDHLGPKAMEYQEDRLTRRYKKNIKDTYDSIKKKAIKATDKIKEMFDN